MDHRNTLVTSKDWFDCLKMQANLHNSSINSDYLSVDMEVVENFRTALCDIVKRENFPANLVFNVAETLTFWKLKPSAMFVSRLVKSG